MAAAALRTQELFRGGEYQEDMSMDLHRPLAVATASTVLAAMLSLATPAQAQTYDPRYPVCLQVYQGFVDYYFECAYTSIPRARCRPRVALLHAWSTLTTPGRRPSAARSAPPPIEGQTQDLSGPARCRPLGQMFPSSILVGTCRPAS